MQPTAVQSPRVMQMEKPLHSAATRKTNFLNGESGSTVRKRRITMNFEQLVEKVKFYEAVKLRAATAETEIDAANAKIDAANLELDAAITELNAAREAYRCARDAESFIPAKSKFGAAQVKVRAAESKVYAARVELFAALDKAINSRRRSDRAKREIESALGIID